MKDIEKYLLDLVEQNSTVVVACSGGPDSMCLLKLLLNIRDKKNIKIVVAHVNHNVRKESNNEKLEVEKYCNCNNIIFEYLLIEKYDSDNFHDYARNIRYNFFDKTVKKYKAKYLMTAHHGDDLMETILMRIVRGSTLRGYAGFNRESTYNGYMLVRPLITKTKKEIQEYMDNNGLWYAIDESNFKDVYTRNRYRKYILPKLKDENPNVHKKFLQFSNKISEVSNFFEKYIDARYNEVKLDNKLDISLLIKEEKVVIDNILSRYLSEYYKNNIYLINDRNLATIYNCLFNKKSSVTIDLPGKYKFIKSYNYCYILLNDEHKLYKYELCDTVDIAGYGKIKTLKDSKESDNNIIYLNSSDLKLPLYVRNRKKGDRMFVKNMPGSKKIKDIFINCKVPIDKRDDYPIVVDSNDEVIWLPGLKKSKFDRKNTGKYDIILKYN